MYHSLLVPLDGSPFGEQALPLAVSIARRAGIPLQVMHVHEPLRPIYYTEPMPGLENISDPRWREQEQAYLVGVAQRLTAIAPLPVTAALLDGPVVGALREHAQATGADLIVMTTHGRGPFSRFWLGSVADQLLRHSPVPLLLVHPHEETPDWTQDQCLPRVLIPLDGSALAEQVLEPALALGRLMRAEYTLFRVVEPLPQVGQDPVSYAPSVIAQEEIERLKVEARVYLGRVAERLREQGLHARTRVVTGPHPAVAILDAARGEGMSVIALATHARRGLARLLLGSVADKVIRGSPVPVFVYRPLTK
jgi:nucleotide-binding universal stress UspA family protein